MKKIFIRSPYFIQINQSGQVGSKVELRFRKVGQSYPVAPNYTLSKKIASATQTNTVYNVSNYAKEFINPISNQKPIDFEGRVVADSGTFEAKQCLKNNINVSTIFDIEEDDLWCFMEVKRFWENSSGVFTLLNTEEFACLNGYTNYSQGVNQSNFFAVLPLYNRNIPIQRQATSILGGSPTKYVNAYLTASLYELIYDVNVTSLGYLTNDFVNRVIGDGGTFEGACLLNIINDLGGTFIVRENIVQEGVYKLPLFGESLQVRRNGSLVSSLSVTSPIICETKYTPVECTFINRFGGWQPLTFFKAKSEGYEMQSVKHKLMPEFINYNTSVGQYKQINFNGKRTIKLNTGYVPENYSELIQDLLLSETILLDKVPVIIKSQGIQIKSNLVDKLINYEVEFEYNFNLINTVL